MASSTRAKRCAARRMRPPAMIGLLVRGKSSGHRFNPPTNLDGGPAPALVRRSRTRRRVLEAFALEAALPVCSFLLVRSPKTLIK